MEEGYLPGWGPEAEGVGIVGFFTFCVLAALLWWYDERRRRGPPR